MPQAKPNCGMMRGRARPRPSQIRYGNRGASRRCPSWLGNSEAIDRVVRGFLSICNNTIRINGSSTAELYSTVVLFMYVHVYTC